MMTFDILTIFPGMFRSYFEASLLKRAIDKGLLRLRPHDLRGYASGKYRETDDYPYGGGEGMVMKPEPIVAATRSLKEEAKGEEVKVVLLTPQGRLFDQGTAWELAKLDRLVLICGRYEGVDERVAEHFVDLELSVGDYVLTGGELPAMVVVDAVARLLPGVVGEAASIQEETFANYLLKYPQYTRPAVFEGLKVPEVLISGNHADIARWRHRQSLRRTYLKRPGLLESAELTPEDLATLKEIKGGRAGEV